MFKKKKKEEPKQDSEADKQTKRLDELSERLEKLIKTHKEFKEMHEEMKAMKLSKLMEKYVTHLSVTDVRTNKDIVDSSDGVITVEHGSSGWLSWTSTELKVNFKDGYELTLRVEKGGD